MLACVCAERIKNFQSIERKKTNIDIDGINQFGIKAAKVRTFYTNFPLVYVVAELMHVRLCVFLSLSLTH